MSAPIIMDLGGVYPIMGPTVMAQASYGDNGPANGPDPELYVGGTDASGTTGRYNWGGTTNADGSWTSDAETILFVLPVSGSGGPSMAVSGATQVTAQGGSSFSSVTAITFAAGVQTNGSVIVGNEQVEFIKNGQVVQTVTPPTGITEDQTASANPGDETIETVLADTDADSVVVEASFQFTLAAGTFAGPSDLFFDIAVSTS